MSLGDVFRLTDTRGENDVSCAIAVERATDATKCASVIVLTSPALSIIVAASAVIAAHLHINDPRLPDPIRWIIARELSARQYYWAQCVCTEFEHQDWMEQRVRVVLAHLKMMPCRSTFRCRQ